MLIDRDGTLIVHKHYLHRPEEVELVRGAAAALRQAQDAGWGLVVVSNQSGVGQGLFEANDVLAVHDRIDELLETDGVKISGYYWSPDAPGSESSTRKPAPGMALAAAGEHGFDVSDCVVVGDNEADILLGNRLHAVSVLVQTGYANHGEGKPDFVIPSLADLMSVLETL